MQESNTERDLILEVLNRHLSNTPTGILRSYVRAFEQHALPPSAGEGEDPVRAEACRLIGRTSAEVVADCLSVFRELAALHPRRADADGHRALPQSWRVHPTPGVA